MPPQNPRANNRLFFAFGLVSFIGFLDAAYLTAKFYLGSTVTCGFFTGCEAVLTSPYAIILGIPVALLGVAYYAFWLFLFVLALDTKSDLFARALWLTSIGFIASLGFIGIQIFIIKAVCLYCLISAAASTIMFFLWLFMRRGRTDAHRNP